MQKMIPALKIRQRYWLEHIQAWDASGTSMAEWVARWRSVMISPLTWGLSI